MRASIIAFAWLLPLFCVDGMARASERPGSLDDWIRDELIPYAAETLATHPRFRDEAVRFVVMEDANPQPLANSLAIGLRDRVQDALMETPGIRIAWHPERPGLRHDRGPEGTSCAADQVHYYLGLEIVENAGGRFEVSWRALDLEDRSWVTGFGRTWQGSLTPAEQRAWRTVEVDRSFLGAREVPFEQSQTDLLAAHLAHELGCLLLRQLDGEFVAETHARDAASETSVVELVTNNLADYRALRLTDEPDAANARIEAQAHRIDNDLFQYWITLRPLDASSGLPALSASAYVVYPGNASPPRAVADATMTLHTQPAVLLGSLELVALERSTLCAAAPHCLALETLSDADTVLFFLNHQVNWGLVRLGDRRCGRQPTARIARANEPLRFSLPVDFPRPESWRSTEVWELDPGAETFHVIAASDSEAAHAVARHIARLPSRCTAAVRPGLEGAALARWLGEFDLLAEAWSARVDWQIIRVKNVY